MDNYISFRDCENADKYCILFAQVLVKNTKVKRLHKKNPNLTKTTAQI